MEAWSGSSGLVQGKRETERERAKANGRCKWGDTVTRDLGALKPARMAGHKTV